MNFQLENGFGIDDGTLKQSGRLFGRHSWVGLKGDFGTVRFGRSWTPIYTLLTDTIDPFEDGMAGAAAGFLGRNVFDAIDVRMQNAIFYSISGSGLTANVAYGLGEVAGNSSANRQISTTLTYANGPLTAVAGYHIANDAMGAGAAKLTLIGGNYNFGPVKVHFGIDSQKSDTTGVTKVDASDVLLGVTVPVGEGRILASYNRYNDKTAANADSSQIAVGYTYALSKRTTLYTSYGHINVNDVNKFGLGIRHKF